MGKVLWFIINLVFPVLFLMPGELDLIIGAYFPVKDRGALAKLTLELETTETRLKAERAGRAEGLIPAPGVHGGPDPRDPLSNQAARTESAIGALIKTHLGRFNSAVWSPLRVHLLDRYGRSFISADELSLIESSMKKSVAEARGVIKPALFYDSLGLRRPKDLPASLGAVKELLRKEMDTRWLSALVAYSADIFLDEMEKLLSALASAGIETKVPRDLAAGLRERRARLLSFFRKAPEYAFLLRPASLFRREDFSSAETGFLKEFFTASRNLAEDEWKHLKSDETVKTLLEARIPGLDVLETGLRLRLAGTLGIKWGALLEDIERLIGVHRTLCDTVYSAPSYAGASPAPEETADAEKLKKLLSDGRSIADRVMSLLARETQGTTPAMRLSVLELLNNRAAGRVFLSDEKYLSLQPVFTAFLEQLYREVDMTVREDLHKGYYLGPSDRIIIRDIAQDVFREERVPCRIVAIFREGIDEFGFPYLSEIENSEAVRAYSRVFWLLTQGSEPDISEEAVLDWAWSHGQAVVSLQLLLNLRSGSEIRAHHLGSYPELLVGDFPAYYKAYTGLVQELAYPWFRRSYRMTFPLLIEEYRARGFEGLFLAQAVLRRISAAEEYSIPPDISAPVTEAEWVTSVLRDLRDLKIPLAEAESLIKSRGNLFETVDRLTILLGKDIELLQTARMRSGVFEEYRIRRSIEGLSPPYFPERGASILRLLNDSLERSSISGAAFMTLRGLVHIKVRELFAVFRTGPAIEKWCSDLYTAGIISGRERTGWSSP